jgi:hypothetical protein
MLQQLQQGLSYQGLTMYNQPAPAADEHIRMVNRDNQFTSREGIAAKARARELLVARLTPEQRETFERNKWFIVIGGKSKRRYRIRDTGCTVANIDLLGELPGGGVVHRLCGHIDGGYMCPLEDHLLGQKLSLEHDEERFLAVANIHR